MKQRDAGLRFEARDGGGDSGLRTVKRSGSTGHVLAFGHGHEKAQLLKRHGPF